MTSPRTTLRVGAKFQEGMRRPNRTRSSTGAAHTGNGRLSSFRSQRVSKDRIPWSRALSAASAVSGGTMGTRGGLSSSPAWIETLAASTVEGGEEDREEGGGAKLLEGSQWCRDKGKHSRTFVTLPRWVNKSYHDLQTLLGIVKGAADLLERSKAAHPNLDLSHLRAVHHSMDGLPNSTLQAAVAKLLSKIRRGKASLGNEDDDNALENDPEEDADVADLAGVLGFTQLPEERRIEAALECHALDDAESDTQSVPDESGGGAAGGGEEDEEEVGERELDPMTDPALESLPTIPWTTERRTAVNPRCRLFGRRQRPCWI